jgi:hypothetical protein
MRPTYTIGFLDVDSYHQVLVRSMVSRAATSLSAAWDIADTPKADLVILGPRTSPKNAPGRINVRLCDQGEISNNPQDLPAPLRLSALLELLKRAETNFINTVGFERAPQIQPAPHAQAQAHGQAQAPAPAPVMQQPAVRTGMLILSESIQKSLASQKPGIIKVLCRDREAMWIDLRRRAFSAPFALNEMPEDADAIRLEIIAASADTASPVPTPGTSLDRLLWHIGLRAGAGRPAPWINPGKRYKLKYWPNFSELPHSITHMNLVARFGSEALSSQEASLRCGVDIATVTNTMNALTLMGLLNENSGVEIRRLQTVTQPEQVSRVGGLIGRFKSKFGW